MNFSKMTDVEVAVTGNMEVPQKTDAAGLNQYLNTNELTSAAKQWFGNRRNNIRPWGTFMSTNNFQTPPTDSRLGRRILRNIDYFQSHYLCVFILLIFYCIITSPTLLFAVPVCIFIGYKLSRRQQRKSLTVLGREVTLAQQYVALGVFSIPFLMWAGVGAALFWVLGVSFFVIILHAAFYNIDAVVPPEDSFETVLEV